MTLLRIALAQTRQTADREDNRRARDERLPIRVIAMTTRTILMLAVLIGAAPTLYAQENESPPNVDFNGDEAVDFQDFILFAKAFGTNQTLFDLDNDGIVGFRDFLFFARWFGVTGAPIPQIRDIGIPVRSVNWVRLHPGRNSEDRPRVYVTMGQQADNLFVLQVDPETGDFHQFVSPVPRSNYPTATLMSRSGRLYIGSAYAGHLLCFDPKLNALLDLGAINPGAATFPCQIDEDQNGRIWIGSYPGADLTVYDPETGEFTRYGRMSNLDKYNYPLATPDGKIACRIWPTRPHVVVFDPATRESYLVGPITFKGQGTVRLERRRDGNLYVITSNYGDFLISGNEGIPVTSLPGHIPRPALPDGSSFFFADGKELNYRTLSIRSRTGRVRSFELDYSASGSDIFYVHTGPEGLIYGSSLLPLHLFRFNPVSGELVDLGKCSSSGGEAYSMANLHGKLYISSYPAARISVYDPSLPYQFGTGPADNPRELGRLDDISYRPRSTLAGPMGRVWIASVPDYGRWGGPLAYYDPGTSERKSYKRIAGDASCYTLAHLESQKLIAVGTTIRGGSGTDPKVNVATLFLWDYHAEEKVWEGTIEGRSSPVTVFNALLASPDGLLYGTARGGGIDELFVFNPESRAFIHRAPLPAGRALDLGLQNGPDGKIYGFTSALVYSLDPATRQVEEVLSVDGGIRIAGPILGKEIYFATGAVLRSATIF